MSVKKKLEKIPVQMDIDDIILKGGSVASEQTKEVTKEIRFPLRIPQHIVEQIDNERKEFGGFLSRNTWILQAIQEKLGKE